MVASPSSMITLQQGETSLMPNAFDQPVIIRLQRSQCQWMLAALVMIAAILLGLWWRVQPHLLLPFTVMIACLQGQRCVLPLLKYHRHQWWLFQGAQWQLVALKPCYIGSWLMSMTVENRNIIVWPDSCTPREQWYLRRALLARQRVRLQEEPAPSLWRRLCCWILG